MRRIVACVMVAGATAWAGGGRALGQAPAAPASAPAAVPAAEPAPAEAPDPVVPVHQEPHHRQVFQYGPTRILDLRIPPNDTSWFHSHEWPVLYVTFSRSQTRTQNLGLEWGARGRGRGAGADPEGGGGARAAGPARGAAPGPPRAGGPPPANQAPRPTSTTSYVETPVTHRLQNIGTGLFWASVVINESQGDETTTAQAAGFTGTPELTNKWFRAYRITLSPGERTATHQHSAPVAIIQATPGNAIGTGATRWEFNQQSQWAFFDAGDSHDVRNTGSVPVELIEVEVRRPAGP